MKHTRDFKVNFHDTYPNGLLRPSAVIKEMQEAVNLCSEEHGPSGDALRRMGYAFVVSKMTVSIYGDMRKYEDLTASTWATDAGGSFSFVRCFDIRRGGMLVAEGIATFAMLDIERGRPVKKGAVPLNYCTDEPIMLDVPTRIHMPDDDAFAIVGEHTVTLSECDENGHMNNTRYADMLCDFIPDMNERRVLTFTVSYLAEAKHGEELTVYRTETEDGVFLFRTVRADGRTNVEAEIVTEEL